jgi:hypothetical protein
MLPPVPPPPPPPAVLPKPRQLSVVAEVHYDDVASDDEFFEMS